MRDCCKFFIMCGGKGALNGCFLFLVTRGQERVAGMTRIQSDWMWRIQGSEMNASESYWGVWGDYINPSTPGVRAHCPVHYRPLYFCCVNELGTSPTSANQRQHR